MKNLVIQIAFLLNLATSLSAAPLTVGTVAPTPPPGGPCWSDVNPAVQPLVAHATFKLPGVTGSGTFGSYAEQVVGTGADVGIHVFYTYSLDLSGMSVADNHCVKARIHFNRPLDCQYDVLVYTNGSAVNVTSASLSWLGDIDFLFGSGGCLLPGKTATTFGMVSDAEATTGSVTIIDDWTDLTTGQSKESRVTVTAIVPDVPPAWLYPIQLPSQLEVPFATFQGNFICNAVPLTGSFNFNLQLLDGPTGLPVTAAVTQPVNVANGLFTMTLPFNPSVFMNNNPLWLNMAVMAPNGNTLTPLGPPLPITPVPQALYAYSAGVVADLAPGQAVTSLNGLKNDVVVAAGTGIVLDTNGNTLTISAAIGSDRNRKTGFMPVAPREILSRLVALPIETWRYTSEPANLRHLGPAAQDFKTAFGLGGGDTTIAIVDEGGVALSAIQGLNQKVDSQNAALRAENAELKRQNESLEKRLQTLEAIFRNQKSN